MQPQDTFSYDIFLSYHWCYHNEVINLHRILTKQGYRVWLDLVEIKFGEYVQGRVEEGVSKSEIFIGFYCDNYGQCQNCELELKYALMENKTIIILCLDPFKPKQTWTNAKSMKIHMISPDVIVNNFKPTNTTSNASNFKFAQHMVQKTKINIEATATILSKFVDSFIQKKQVKFCFYYTKIDESFKYFNISNRISNHAQLDITHCHLYKHTDVKIKHLFRFRFDFY